MVGVVGTWFRTFFFLDLRRFCGGRSSIFWVLAVAVLFISGIEASVASVCFVSGGLAKPRN